MKKYLLNQSSVKFLVLSTVFLVTALSFQVTAAQVVVDPTLFPVGTVSLTFDDGSKTIFNNIDSVGSFKTTQYIISGAMQCADGGVGCADFMTSANVKTLYDAGHEIGAHTRTDPTGGSVGLTSDELLFQVDGLRKDLLQMIGAPVNTFAYPFGLFDDTLVAKLRAAGILSARTVDFIDAQGQPMYNTKASDFYKLSAIHVTVDTPITSTDPLPVGWQPNYGYAEKWIDDVVAQKKWLIFLFHKVDAACTGAGIPIDTNGDNVNDSFDPYCTTPAKLAHIRDYLVSKNADVSVLPVKDVIAQINDFTTDTVAPVVTQADVTVTTASTTASVILTPTVTDNVATGLNAFCTVNVPRYPATTTNPFGGDPVWGVQYLTVANNGYAFPLGTTTVTCTAADYAGNIGTSTSNVIVNVANTAPLLSNVPANMTVYTSVNASTTVTYTNPTATDTPDGTVPVTCNPASGSLFAVGTTTVMCSASDSNFATTTASFAVGVVFTPDTTVEILPVSLPDSIVNTSYSQTLIASTSVTGSVVWELTSGSLPEGMLLASTTGVVSGTATTTGTSTFTVKATVGSSSATKTYTINVITAPVTPTPPPSSGGGGGGGGGGIIQSSKLGDVNRDGRIDILDYVLLMANWGMQVSNSSDLNRDGKVDILDYVVLMANWGK